MFVFQMMLGIHFDAKTATDMLNVHELEKSKLGTNSPILHAAVIIINRCDRTNVAQEAPIYPLVKKQVL